MASITLRTSAQARHDQPGIDWWMLIFAALLTLIGLGAIFSSGYGVSMAEFKKQLLYVVVGIVPMAIFAGVHPRMWSRGAKPLYVANILLLGAVLAMGSTRNGAERWINVGPMQFQPSELSKILIVLTLASFYATRQERMKEFSTFILGFLHVIVPVALILKQPHLGASILVMVVWMALSLVAGVRPLYMLATGLIFASVAGLVIGVPAVRKKLLLPYQIERVEALISSIFNSKNVKETKEDRDKRYQVTQASYSFANGGTAGTGWLKGEMKRRVPFQSTDFIFSLIGEEFGFMGCVAVLLLYGLLFYRIWMGMLSAADLYYQLVMAGILTILSFHTIVNIAMVLGMAPVVGLWCPFLSFGGTAIWLCMSLIGLALNVRSRERVVLF